MMIEEYGDDNFQNEARNIRYQFFDDVVLKYGAKFLFTAHHAWFNGNGFNENS